MTTKQITLDENGFATDAGYIIVYNGTVANSRW